MARITMTIEADNAGDLAQTLSYLGDLMNGDAGDEERQTLQPDAGVTQDAEPGERQRRRRRTKAEMDAARAAGDGSAGGAATLASKLGTEAGTSATGGATSAIDDPFAEPKPASPATSDASQASLTASDVRDAMSAWLGRDNHQAEGMLPIFAKFKTTEGDPCARASQLQASDYAAFIEALKA
jgi:hypothetical protein